MHDFTRQARAAAIVMSAAASRRCHGKVAVPRPGRPQCAEELFGMLTAGGTC